MDIHRLFKRGEMATISCDALKGRPAQYPRTAQAIMAAKGLDTGDKVLAKGVAYRLIHVLRIRRVTARLSAWGGRRGRGSGDCQKDLFDKWVIRGSGVSV